MRKHALILLGDHQDEVRVSAQALHEAVGALIEGARRATRFAVESESTRKGPRPAWLDAACKIDVVGLSAGSAVISLEAPTLANADPRFADSGKRIASSTAIDLFGNVLTSLVSGAVDDVNADRPLLDSCLRFARLAGSAGVRLDGLS